MGLLKIAILFVLELLSLCQSASVKSSHQKVRLRLPHGHNGSEPCLFPSTFPVQMNSQYPFRGHFVLQRKDVVSTSAPAYVIQTQEHGALHFEKLEESEKRISAYQCDTNGAAIIVRCTRNTYQLEGVVYLEGLKYRIKPSGEDGQDAEYPDVSYDFDLVKDTPSNEEFLRRKRRRNVGADSLPSPAEGSAPRRKRDTKKDYYIDILVILDFAFYRFWNLRANNDSANATRQAKEYIAYIFNGINSRFNSITTLPYNIHIQLSGFLIATSAKDSPWTETVKESAGSGVTQVNADKVLSSLENYVATTTLPASDIDHVMLYTDYDLFGEDHGFRFNNTAGFADVGTMCYSKEGKSVSIVEDHGGFQSEGTASHEIGHSLGALHDGYSNNSCSSSDKYIMAGEAYNETVANKLNPWRFSSCSIEYFRIYIEKMITEKYEDSCLLKKASTANVTVVSGLPGQLVSHDKQCQMIYGQNSYLCRDAKFGTPEDICTSMYCLDPTKKAPGGGNYCTLNTAAQGTCCGNNKWCVDGSCVSSPNATCYMSATCPYGERQGIVVDGLTCAQLLPSDCYLSGIRSVCCEMCDRNYIGLPGCEFGNKADNCKPNDCWNNNNKNVCCATCYVPTSTKPSTTTTSTTRTTSATLPTSPSPTTKATSTTTTSPTTKATSTTSPSPTTKATSTTSTSPTTKATSTTTTSPTTKATSATTTSPTTKVSSTPSLEIPTTMKATTTTSISSPTTRATSSLANTLAPTTTKTIFPTITPTTTHPTTTPPTKPAVYATTTSRRIAVVDCIPILGVRQCGSGQAVKSSALIIIVLVTMVIHEISSYSWL